MKNKNILIIIIGVILVGIISCFTILSNNTEKDNINNSSGNNEIKEDITIDLEEEYILEKGAIPTLDMFTTISDANMKVYYESIEVTGPLDKVGEYSVVITLNKKEYRTKIIVLNNAPTLLLKVVTIKENEKYEINDFIEKIEGTDNYNITFQDESMEKYTKAGTYDIIIKLTYDTDKIVTSNTKLIINKVEVSNSNSNINNTSNKTNNKASNKTSTSNKTSNKNSNNNVVGSNSNSTSNNPSNSNVTGNSNSNMVSNSNSNSNITPTIVKTENKEDVTTQTKYGSKIITTTKYLLTTYSDDSTKRKDLSTSKTLDSSGFVTSTSAMLSEATSISKNALSERKEVTNYVNQYRKEKSSSLGTLVLDEKLSIAATIRAMELAYTDYKYKHNRPDGTAFSTVIKEVYGSYSAAGENIATGWGGEIDNAKEVSEAWKNSASHYTAMTHASFTKIGVGHVTLLGKEYWVQLFAG